MIIDNFVTRSGKTGLEGKLDVRLVVENIQGIAIFDQTRTITPLKDSQDLSISMKWLQKGKYYVVVEVKDIFTGLVIKKRLNAGI